MRRYEQIYILRPSLSEEEINRVIDNTTQIIQNVNGTIIFIDRWGMKKLAYPIKKETQGYYVFCDFAATPEAVAEIERKFRIDDAVFKYLTIKIADTISNEQITLAVSEAETKKSAAADSEENAETEESSETTAEKQDTKKTTDQDA